MTSNQLTSFIHQKSNQLTRIVTIKSIWTDSPATTVVRNNGNSTIGSNTYSKVKKFGSLLVRNKERPPIDTSTTTKASLSLVSSVNSEDSEEEEDVMTPNTSTTQFKDILFASSAGNRTNLDIMSVTPKDQSNQLSTVVATIDPSAEQQTITLNQMCNSKEKPKSDVSIVKDQLRTAFEQIDIEIEQGFELSRHQMMRSIRTTPRILC